MKLAKKSADVNLDIHPDFALAAPLLRAAWVIAGAPEAVVTSGRDGMHSAKSAHYTGNAIDLRSFSLQMDYTQFCYRLAKLLNGDLPGDWYVVLECDHIHLERTDDGGRPNIKGFTAGQHVYIQGSRA